MQQTDSPLTRLRRAHQATVVGLLRRQGPLSRAELGARSGLSRTTLYDIVAGLLGSGVVVAAGPQGPRRRGRPVELISLNPAAGYALGIDFARRAVQVAVVNAAHEVIGTAREEHPAGLGRAERVRLAQRLVAGTGAAGAVARERRGLDGGGFGGIGVGVVGPVLDGSASASGTTDERLLLVEDLTAAFGPVPVVDNNTRLAALAEATWGAAAGCADALYLRLSHGVGGGMVVGGALHRGVGGLSGEIGHIVVEPDGLPCECGGRGCLETVASLGAVLAAAHARGARVESPAHLREAAAAGDPAVLGALAHAAERVGRVLAVLCNAFGPSVLVIGGELADTGAALLEPLEAALRAGTAPFTRPRLDLRRAVLGEYGGALGGIALALHESPLLVHYTAPDDPDTQRPPGTRTAGTRTAGSRTAGSRAAGTQSAGARPAPIRTRQVRTEESV